MSEKKETFLSRKEVATLLRADETTIDRWSKEGKFPKYGIGRKILFKRTEIESAIIEL